MLVRVHDVVEDFLQLGAVDMRAREEPLGRLRVT
jgi:hypothetical protein